MTLADLQPTAQRHWAKTDPVMAKLSRANPLPKEPHALTADGFATLTFSIVHQQVSMAAARTIQARLVKTLGGKVTPRRVVNRSPDDLRAAGLSRSKVAFLHDLADKTLRKEVDFDRFPDLDDATILDELTAVKGIGTWTAKMFLMFHLHRPDVLPHEDLGLRLAVADVYGVPMERTAAFMQDRAPAWSPFASVASRVLWLSRRAPPTP